MNEQAERPAWLPPKFKTPEDLAKSYTELERKLGTPAPVSVQKPKPTPSAEADETAEMVAKEVLSEEETPDAGMIPEIDLEAITGEPPAPNADPEKDRQEVADVINKGLSGPLDAEALARLEKAGISREAIQQIQQRMEDGQRAKAQLMLQDLTKGIGGLEKWAEVQAWAGAELPKADQDGLNEIFNGGNPTAMRLAIEGLHHQFRKAQGPQFLTGNRGNDAPASFGSQEQLVDAMKDPRYKRDPVYRKSVEDRALRADFAPRR